MVGKFSLVRGPWFRLTASIHACVIFTNSILVIQRDIKMSPIVIPKQSQKTISIFHNSIWPHWAYVACNGAAFNSTGQHPNYKTE